MSVLNYSQLFKSTSGKQDGIDWLLSASARSEDWLKIAFAPDQDALGAGHLVTHGLDFLKDYIAGHRGMVPTAPSGKTLQNIYFRGDGWQSYYNIEDETKAGDALVGGKAPTAEQRAQQINTYRKNTLVSAYDIKNWINDSFAAQDAMRFRGVISIDANNNITTTPTGSTSSITGLPTSCIIGDVYKISVSGKVTTLFGQPVSSGDMIVCINNGSGNINSANYWAIIQSNVEYISSITVNGQLMQVYAPQKYEYTFYAPTTKGSKPVNGVYNVVVADDNGNATWAQSSALKVLYATEAGKVTNSLTVSGGIAFVTGTSYNGEVQRQLKLLPATTSRIGGVIIDNGTKRGTTSSPKPTVSVDTNGVIYLTQDNIVNALGYVPGNNAASNSLILGNSATATTNITANTSTPFINFIGTDPAGQSTVKKAISFIGAANSGITVNATTAGIVVGSSIFTATSNGVVPMFSTANKQTSGKDNIFTQALATNTFVLGSDAKWYRLPASAFEGTWRGVSVGNTQILNRSPKNASGNFNPDLTFTTFETIEFGAVQDSNGNYTGGVIAGLRWCNIDLPDSDPNKYETIW